MTKKFGITRKPSVLHSATQDRAHHQDNEFNIAELDSLDEKEKQRLYENYHLTGDFEKDISNLSLLTGCEIRVHRRLKVPRTPTPSESPMCRMNEKRYHESLEKLTKENGKKTECRYIYF